MPNKPSRRHHTVAQLHLKRFESADRQLWATDSVTGHQRRGSTINETVRNGFYERFETALGHLVDTPTIAEIFDKIEAGGCFCLSDVEVATLHMYLGIQHTRTPAYRAVADEMLRETLREHVRLEHREQPHVAQELEGISAAFRHDVAEATLLMLDNGTAIAAALCGMKTWVIRAPDPTFFVTSDCPVAIGPFLDGHDRPLGLRDDAVTFAISPQTALLKCNHLTTDRYFDVRAGIDTSTVVDLVSKVNRLITRRCGRWLYSHRQDAAQHLELSFPLERFRTHTRTIASGIVRTSSSLDRHSNSTLGHAPGIRASTPPSPSGTPSQCLRC